MVRLDGIIRFKTRELDEQRKQLVIVEEQLQAIDDRLSALEAEEARESQNINLESAATNIGAYLHGVRVRRAQLEESRVEKQTEVDEKRNEVQLAFEELKTLEIAEERQIAREQAEQAKAQQQELDETALRPFHHHK